MDAKTPAGTDAMKSIVLQAIQNMTPADLRAVVMEIESFFNGMYPCLDGDALKWWKVHMTHLYLWLYCANCCCIYRIMWLTCIVQDILAILGVSISVKGDSGLIYSTQHSFSHLRPQDALPPNMVIPTHNSWEYSIFRLQNFSIWPAQNILYYLQFC